MRFSCGSDELTGHRRSQCGPPHDAHGRGGGLLGRFWARSGSGHVSGQWNRPHLKQGPSGSCVRHLGCSATAAGVGWLDQPAAISAGINLGRWFDACPKQINALNISLRDGRWPITISIWVTAVPAWVPASDVTNISANSGAGHVTKSTKDCKRLNSAINSEREAKF